MCSALAAAVVKDRTADGGANMRTGYVKSKREFTSKRSMLPRNSLVDHMVYLDQ